jgi:hypothetical protein
MYGEMASETSCVLGRSALRFMTILLRLLAAEASVVISSWALRLALALFLAHVPDFLPGGTVLLSQAIVSLLLVMATPALATWTGFLVACRVLGGSSHAVLWSVLASRVLMAVAAFLGSFMALSLERGDAL